VAAEDKELRVKATREDTTEEYSFDALAKGLASGTLSRRKVLKLMSTSILGAGVLAFFPSVSTAAEGAKCPDSGTGCDVECRGDKARNRNCVCIRTAEGKRKCVRPCCSGRGCNSSNDCRSGEVCMKTTCCGDVRGVCAPKCTAERPNYCDTSATQSSDATTPQPTDSGTSWASRAA
jgi:hypothetical protein